MLVRDVKDCNEFKGEDNSILRELLHPEKADIRIHYSLAHAIVEPQQATLAHRLKTSEVYYILQGEGLMHIGDESVKVCSHQAVYIPPGSVQFIENISGENLVFLCLVDPAWRREDEEIIA